jgi:hypothetical protein
MRTKPIRYNDTGPGFDNPAKPIDTIAGLGPSGGRLVSA